MNVSAAAAEGRQVSDEQFARFAELIYRKTGVRIPPQKKTLLSNRLRRRLKARALASYGDYLTLLERLRPADPEWDQLFQEVTTHETFLFREMVQWDWFRNEFLANLQNRGERCRSLRVWSAACSTGDEAYTIAACVAERLPQPEQWRIEIVGTDIGVGVLEEARAPLFNARRMHDVPTALRKRFFRQPAGSELWEPAESLRRMTAFRQHNLMEPLAETPFDVVFVRNVLIYFDDASKQTVLNRILASLRPGGYLVTGRAEGVTHLLRCCQRIQPWLHRKESEGDAAR
jgi:chemotaxis protein methyltransferase CheR